MLHRTSARALLTLTAACALACGGTQAGAGGARPTPSGPEMQCTTDAMRPGTGESNSATLASAIAGCHRTARNADRDRFRHPAETLTFFGLSPEMQVLELSPGGGWYTDILAPVLRDEGHLSVALNSAQGAGADRFRGYLSRHADLFGEVGVVTLADMGPDESYDMVLTFRNLHNWHGRGDGVDGVFQRVFRALRPGGVFGVVEHRADEGADVNECASTGYMPQAWVIERAEAAGFVLAERSEINANERDDHDHPRGVWTLPPVLRLGDQDRQQYLAIGESDRMTLRFTKPEGAAEAATGHAQ